MAVSRSACVHQFKLTLGAAHTNFCHRSTKAIALSTLRDLSISQSFPNFIALVWCSPDQFPPSDDKVEVGHLSDGFDLTCRAWEVLIQLSLSRSCACGV